MGHGSESHSNTTNRRISRRRFTQAVGGSALAGMAGCLGGSGNGGDGKDRKSVV